MYEKKRKFFSAIIITALIFSMPMYIYADTGNRTDQSGTLQNISENIVRNVSDQMTIEEFVTGVAEINEKSSGFSLFSSVPKVRLIVKAESEPHVSGANEIFGGYDGYYIVVYENKEKAEAGKEELISQDNVECVEQDMELQLSATGSEYTYQTLKNWGKGEADPLGIEYINNAIMVKYGNDVAAMPEVIVAVIDSGVEKDHPFLSGRLTAGTNVTSGEMTDVGDTVGHGTSVAGIIADVSLPNVKIMPVRVADEQGKVYA